MGVWLTGAQGDKLPIFIKLAYNGHSKTLKSLKFTSQLQAFEMQILSKSLVRDAKDP